MSDARCAKCGHPRSNHPYRHQFVGPSKDDTIKELEAALAKAVGQMQRVKDYRYDPNIGIELNRLEETLAELKGGRDE